jgi:hypothetical protein
MRIVKPTWFLESKVIICAVLVAVVLLAAQSASGEIALYGCDNQGQLFVIDPATGAGTLDCLLPTYPDPGATEMEFEMWSGMAIVQGRDGIFSSQLFDFDNGVAAGDLVYNGYAFNGLEFVDGVLYGTGVPHTCEPSQLMILDPETGEVTPIGPTNLGPISGMAWDPDAQIMYGVTGCADLGFADLVKIDLSTGTATVVGNTGLSLGSLEFGPDGKLYAGGNNRDGGNLYSIDPMNANATYIGPTGFSNVTGLVLAAKTIIAELDFKPRSCPNKLNIKPVVGDVDFELLKKGGLLPLAVLGTDEFDVHDIDPATLLIQGVPPLRHSYEDVAAPLENPAGCDCTDEGPDGYMDLALKVLTEDIVDILGHIADGGRISLTLTGRLYDGSRFEATDCLEIIGEKVDPMPMFNEGEGNLVLGPAVPNPFNPITQIRYELPSEGFVTLAIYDVAGRRVDQIVNGVQPAGEHVVEWNAGSMPSGVYFYRLDADGIAKTRKMILMK